MAKEKVKINVKLPHCRPGDFLRVSGGSGFSEYLDSWHKEVVRLSVLNTGRLYFPSYRTGTHFC